MIGSLPEAILFDLDGTLLDLSNVTVDALAMLLDEERAAPIEDGYRPPLSIGVTALLDRFFGPLAHARRSALEHRFETHFNKRACQGVRMYGGMEALLEGVECCSLSWGIVTSRAGAMVEPIVARLGLTGRLRCLVTGSSGLPKKPRPEPLLRGASEIGVCATKCVYVGDTESDMKAAAAAGMGSFVAAWGTRGGSSEGWTKWADAVFKRPEDILERIQRTSKQRDEEEEQAERAKSDDTA